MSDGRVCVVRLNDDHGVERRVKVLAESVHEVAGITLSRSLGPKGSLATSSQRHLWLQIYPLTYRVV
jgi:GTP-sensing pleiotropic transcriptional regulator CodY